jgi:hypothetical protein
VEALTDTLGAHALVEHAYIFWGLVLLPILMARS